MDIEKSTGKRFSGLAISLGEAQRRFGEKPKSKKGYYINGGKEGFIRPMWLTPEEHKKVCQ